MSLRISDETRIPDILRALEELSRKKLIIGIFGENDSKILMIARVNEFGCQIDVTPKMRAYLHSQGLHLKDSTTKINIPERSFMRGGFDANVRNIERTAQNLLDKLLRGQINTEAFFRVLGESIVGMIQRYLTDLSEPPKHPFTIAQNPDKTNPLIQSGKLRQSITWKVE